MARNGKLNIRNNIIVAAQAYRDELAGKYFMYIFEGKHVEILFKTSNFSHLTGVVTSLSGKEFYKKAKGGVLNSEQFYFTDEHPFDLAKKKTNKLDKLFELTQKDTFIIEDMSSGSKIYKIGVTNLDYTLGVIENRDDKTKKIIDDFLIPATFRVRGESDFNKNKNVYTVDAVLMKDNKFKKYDTICFGNIKKIANLPKDVLELIDNKLISR